MHRNNPTWNIYYTAVQKVPYLIWVLVLILVFYQPHQRHCHKPSYEPNCVNQTQFPSWRICTKIQIWCWYWQTCYNEV